MRWTPLIVAGIALSQAGCQLWRASAHNILNEPIEYLDQNKLANQLEKDAKLRFKELESHFGRKSLSEDFEQGFVDGYTDYLEHGGQATPPAIPPLKYRRSKFLNPDGHARIHDYFAGFQQGADAACETGQRTYLTLPILLPEPDAEAPVKVQQIPAEDCDPTRSKSSGNLPRPKPTNANPPVKPETGVTAPNRHVDPLPNPGLPGLPKLPNPALPKAPGSDLPKLDLPKSDPPKTGTTIEPTTAPLFRTLPLPGSGGQSKRDDLPSELKTTGLSAPSVSPAMDDGVVKPRSDSGEIVKPR